MTGFEYLVLREAGLVILGYLAGSVSFSALAGRLRGVDLRKTGSGNLGATNVFSVLGKPTGLAVFGLDVFKGSFPCIVAQSFSAMILGDGHHPGFFEIVLAGVGAVIGPLFPVVHQFKGGKGVATSLGVVLVAAPFESIIALVIFIPVVWMTRYISLGSLVATISVPVFSVVNAAFFHMGPAGNVIHAGGFLPAILFAPMAYIIYRTHRGNLRRIREKTETRFSWWGYTGK